MLRKKKKRKKEGVYESALEPVILAIAFMCQIVLVSKMGVLRKNIWENSITIFANTFTNKRIKHKIYYEAQTI